jgi:hypothetical protein
MGGRDKPGHDVIEALDSPTSTPKADLGSFRRSAILTR